MGWVKRAAVAAVILAVAFVAWDALAGEPRAWQLGFQEPASPVKERIHSFHNLLLVIITLISLFVLVLLLYTIVRFRATKHPTPTRVTHNTVLEVAWTVVPILILIVIFIPSIRLLYYMDKTASADMTIKVVGHQWYWSYEYPDQGDLKFDSYMVAESDLKPGQKRLLEVDNRLVVPTGANIRVLVAGVDVMHSFFIPALGVQIYSVPGRTNETWMRLDKPGVYYGQCNQICGINHGFMPIAVEALDKAGFERWLADAKKKFAAAPAAPVVAAAQTR